MILTLFLVKCYHNIKVPLEKICGFPQVTLQELNHLSTTMTVSGSLQNLYHYKSLMPSKSMPQKRNHDFTERYPNLNAGTLYESMRIKDILTKSRFFTVCLCF